jgi:hypothetical protein
MNLRESRVCFLFRVALVENRADSSRAANPLASHARLSRARLRLLEIVRLRRDNSATFDRYWDDKLPRRLLDWLLVVVGRCHRR